MVHAVLRTAAVFLMLSATGLALAAMAPLPAPIGATELLPAAPTPAKATATPAVAATPTGDAKSTPTRTAAPEAVPYKAEAGPLEVVAVKYEWTDATRDRPVPVKIYYPKVGAGPYPVIIFSHGLGGSRDTYEYLGRYWASYGYVSVHVQHLGSDTLTVWQSGESILKALTDAAADPRNAVQRPLDVRFAIDEMTKLNAADSPLKGRLDLGHVGMAGHSFGAYTTMAVAGEVFGAALGRAVSLADPRVKAAIAMSTPVPKVHGDLDKAFSQVRIPVFHMTGTKDDSPVGETAAADRRLPYDHCRASDQLLVIFEGGDHMIFSGRPRLAAGGEKDAEFQKLIQVSSLAFWDAYLKPDMKKKAAWLTDGGFAAALGKLGTFEHKSPAEAPAK